MKLRDNADFLIMARTLLSGAPDKIARDAIVRSLVPAELLEEFDADYEELLEVDQGDLGKSMARMMQNSAANNGTD